MDFFLWQNIHKIHHFNHLKVYNSVAFGTFRMLCNHHHPKHSYHPEKETLCPLSLPSPLHHPPQPLATPNMLSL